jgi:hypothetical protein
MRLIFADLNIEGIISGDCVLPIDLNLEFRIETRLSVLMKLSTLELIMIVQSEALGVNYILEYGWPLLFHLIRIHSDGNWISLAGWTAIHIADQKSQFTLKFVALISGGDGTVSCFKYLVRVLIHPGISSLLTSKQGYLDLLGDLAEFAAEIADLLM